MLRITAALALAAASLLAYAQAPSVPPSTAAAAPAPLNPALENSVVKVFSTLRGPDPYKPWTKAAPVDITGSGVVIEGKRILTNAHVVGYASQVQVQANQAGDKLSATVVAVAPGADLALLKLDDESFFDTHPAVLRTSALPDVREPVFAYGYPTGGNSLSITKGIVSRIEFTNYSPYSSGLRVQIDAAINPGNSGGPVISGDKMVGLAFATATNAQNIGYIIPNEEIALFLRDVKDGKYDGKPALHDEYQTLENPALRAYLKLAPNVTGAVVRRPAFSDSAYPLHEWDVVTRIGERPVDNQAMVSIGPNLRVRFQYLVQQLAKDGKVPLTIVRDGKTMQVQVPVPARRHHLIADLNGAYPSYFIYGPIVFSRATAEFASFLFTSAQAAAGFSMVGSALVTRRGDLATPEREELVVVSSPFFPNKSVTGYSQRFGSVVESVNGTPVRSLAHLVALLRDAKDELVVLRFEQRHAETMVLRRKDVLDATESILSDNGIRMQGSQDMLEIWNRK